MRVEARDLTAGQEWQSEMAQTITQLATRKWGNQRRTVLIGRHPVFTDALSRVARVAASDGPVLVTGETGTGKELFARAIYLLSRRAERPFITVNCAQYQDSQLIASELFGHRRGSFTGAVTDHRGVFEDAEGGTVFLDEVGELSLAAQAMLLRALSEGEIVPVGETRARQVDVRVIAATSRDLQPMIEAGRFRRDLYYRLRNYHLAVPPVRERGDDWRLIAAFHLEQLARQSATAKRFSSDAMVVLSRYHWPGNVRELRSVVDIAYHMSDGDVIEACDFAAELENHSRAEQLRKVPVQRLLADAVDAMAADETNFWDAVYHPFMNREMNRGEVREIIAMGLDRTRGSYKTLLELLGVAPSDYLKFMDFLRHQRLKPD